jgi:hypothetical protein
MIPLLYLVGATGLALLASGCSRKKSESDEFPKSDLEVKNPDSEEKLDGYQSVFFSLGTQFRKSQGQPFSLEPYLKDESSQWSLSKIFDDRKQLQLAKKFVTHLAANDERPNDISPYDILFEPYHLYGQLWKEDWISQFYEQDLSGDYLHERLRILGLPLTDPAASPALKARSRDLLQSFATYARSRPPTDFAAAALATLNYFLNPVEPPVFSNYLQSSFKDFLHLEETKQTELFRSAVQRQFPDRETTEKIFDYLTQKEAVLFIRECLKKDPAASLELFEKVHFPNWGVNAEKNSDESDFFPKLPQATSFETRQKAIDDFLGKPVSVMERKNSLSTGAPITTTLKKYIWTGDTEVFSIESGKPGPTTLVFSPHFHEHNPRKMFHWIKDLPLTSGRVILIPEANRAMARAGKNTDPMNGLFNEAFTRDGIDYLIVRRTEYLMGLVDGMVGIHDSIGGPFYISDLIEEKEKGDPNLQGPVPSPWVPEEVKKIEGLRLSTDHPSKETLPLQVQWQIADFSRSKLQALTERQYGFQPESITDKRSGSADSATAYMNYHLHKPAMTFEGRKRAEHGQLLATALYTLLLGFGHGIDPHFENTLKNPNPNVEPDLYKGLPPVEPPSLAQALPNPDN